MNYDVVIGIDCGKSGSISSYYNKKYHAVKMPSTSEDVSSYIKYLSSIGNAIVIVEKVMLRSGDENNHKMFRMAKLVKNYNEVVTVLKILGVDFVEVFPKTWQNYITPDIKEVDYSIRKKRLKYHVENMLKSHIKVTLWNADALLLVLFGIKKQQFDPFWLQANKYNKPKTNQTYLNL